MSDAPTPSPSSPSSEPHSRAAEFLSGEDRRDAESYETARHQERAAAYEAPEADPYERSEAPHVGSELPYEPVGLEPDVGSEVPYEPVDVEPYERSEAPPVGFDLPHEPVDPEWYEPASVNDHEPHDTPHDAWALARKFPEKNLHDGSEVAQEPFDTERPEAPYVEPYEQIHVESYDALRPEPYEQIHVESHEAPHPEPYEQIYVESHEALYPEPYEQRPGDAYDAHHLEPYEQMALDAYEALYVEPYEQAGEEPYEALYMEPYDIDAERREKLAADTHDWMTFRRRRGTSSMVASLIAALFVVAVSMSFLPPGWESGRPLFNSPRTTVGYSLSLAMAEQGHPSIPIKHAGALPADVEKAMTPRDAASVDGRIVPQDFAGTIVVHALAASIHPALVPFVAIAGALLAGFAAARFAGDLTLLLAKPGRTQERAAMRSRRIAAISFVVMPAMMLSASEGFAQDPLSSALLLFAASAFLRYWTSGSQRELIMMSAFFSAAITFRYPLALLAVGPFIVCLICKKMPLRHIALAAGIAAGAMTAVLAFNTWVYGDPFTSGYSIRSALVRETINPSDVGFDTPVGIWIGNLRYVLHLPFLLLPVVGMLCVLSPRTRRSKAFMPLVGLVGGAVLYTLWHAMQNLWGTFSLQANASILRYTLPVAGLGLVMLFVALESAIRASAAARTTFAVCVVFIYAAASLHTSNAALDRDDQLARGRELRDAIIANTEADAIIMSLRADKYLWPPRQTLSLPYLNVNAEPKPIGESHPTKLLPPVDRVVYAAKEILDEDIPLYLLGDFGLDDARKMVRSLRRADLKVKRATYDARLWVVTTKSAS